MYEQVGRDLEYPCRAVIAAGGDTGAIRAEHHGPHLVVVVKARLLHPGGGVDTRAEPPLLPVATRAPSGLTATAHTRRSWSSRASSPLVAVSNTRAEPSLLPVATQAPSGLNATVITQPSWSSRASSSPVAVSNTRADPSLLAVAMRVPSGLNATAHTRPSWPSRATSVPAAGSNTRAEPSLLPVATWVPSGLNTTAFTGPSWSRRASVGGCRRRTCRSARSPCRGLDEEGLRTKSKRDDRSRVCGAQGQFGVGSKAQGFGAACCRLRTITCLTQLAQPHFGCSLAALDEPPDRIWNIARPGIEPAPRLGDPRIQQRISLCGALLNPREPIEKLGVLSH